jgi:phage gpG-like protein
MITIALTTNAQQVLAGLRAFPSRMAAGICSALDRENELTVAHIAEARMSQRGPTTLGRITSRLVRSVRRTRAVATATEVVSAIGSNVEYMGVHEFGFRGIVTVKKHVRRIASRDVRGVVDQKRRIVAKGVAFVREHEREMDVPQRAPIRLGIEDRAAAYTASISSAIERAWGETA